MSRKDRERERHRREILEAAERIFVNKGYHATTIEAIAEEAQFAVGTLYNFFKGKDDLYTNVIEGFAREFFDQFEKKVLSVSDPEAAIVALIELRLAHFQKHREFLRIAFEASFGSRVDPVRALVPRLTEMHDRYVEAVARVFERGIAQGIFDQGDPLDFALGLQGVINAFVAYWSRHGPAESAEARVSKIKRVFLERIKSPVRGSPESVGAPEESNAPLNIGAGQ